MDTHILFYNSSCDKRSFELSSGVRPWGILLAISRGKIKVDFPSFDQSEIISPYEIAYMPPGVEFHREIIEPIDFYQFAFQIFDGRLSNLPRGKLKIPKEQVRAILESADNISKFPSEAEALNEHILERILIENHLFSNTDSQSGLSQAVINATSYIQKNIDRVLSVAALAKELHLSHNGLIWKFKKELNMTPQKYIAACRIKYSKQLLFEDNLTINQIAERCGFANAYYFSNAFKKSEGISPTSFRKRCIK